jgi:hypothetical protein
MHVPFSLSRIIMSSLLFGIVLSVCTCWFHSMVTLLLLLLLLLLYGNYFENIQHLILPTFLYGSENWTLTASQRRKIETTEMKLLRPLAGCIPSWPQNKRLHTPWTTD